MIGLRGFESFHSMGYYAVTFIMACLLFKEYFLDKKRYENLLVWVLIIVTLVSLSHQFVFRWKIGNIII